MVLMPHRTYNEVLVSEPLNWIPVNSNSTWQVQLDGLTVTTFGRGAENIGFVSHTHS